MIVRCVAKRVSRAIPECYGEELLEGVMVQVGLWATVLGGFLPGCDSSTGGDASDMGDTQLYLLDSGDYWVRSVVTHDNDCSADWSYMQDQTVPVAVSGDEVDFGGILLIRQDNELSGYEYGTIDWSGIGRDCATDIEDVLVGSVYDDFAFGIEWTSTWAFSSGDYKDCYDAMGHDLPCTYGATFDMVLVD